LAWLTPIASLQPVAEEAADRSRVRVIMIRDVPHVVVDIVLELEELADHCTQAGVHVREIIRWWDGTVTAPDDHRDRADLALRDPTDVVLVKPWCNPRRVAQIAVVDTFVGCAHRAFRLGVCSRTSSSGLIRTWRRC
jgi:hypothetical protein